MHTEWPWTPLPSWGLIPLFAAWFAWFSQATCITSLCRYISQRLTAGFLWIFCICTLGKRKHSASSVSHRWCIVSRSNILGQLYTWLQGRSLEPLVLGFWACSVADADTGGNDISSLHTSWESPLSKSLHGWTTEGKLKPCSLNFLCRIKYSMCPVFSPSAPDCLAHNFQHFSQLLPFIFSPKYIFF